MNLLDLFSGIGAFSLGLERAGFKTVAFCEIEPFCRQVLAKHWPTVPCYDDIRDLTAARLRDDGIGPIDAICGGFPCQDISLAGSGAGLDGERSGLWREYARLVGELRPRHVIVENVGALRARGLAAVLGDFAALGYDAEWHSVPAAAVGAPHLRDRVWIIATAADSDSGCSGSPPCAYRFCRTTADDGADADTHGVRQLQRERRQSDERGWAHNAPEAGGSAAVTGGQRCTQRIGLQRRLARALAAVATPWDWPAEPPFRRVNDAAAKRLDRAALKALGNSVVPDIPEAIGRALMEPAL